MQPYFSTFFTASLTSSATACSTTASTAMVSGPFGDFLSLGGCDSVGLYCFVVLVATGTFVGTYFAEACFCATALPFSPASEDMCGVYCLCWLVLLFSFLNLASFSAAADFVLYTFVRTGETDRSLKSSSS